MADNSFTSDDFDKLLDDFISNQLQDTEDALAELDDTPAASTIESSDNTDNSLSDTGSSDEETSFSLANIQEHLSDANFEKLAEEEKRLYNSYMEFIESVKVCGTEAKLEIPEFSFSAHDLLPRFRPSRSQNLNHDILAAWEILIQAQPTRLSSLPQNASDEQILDFAEKTTSKSLQMALIAYVETLIEVDACEIAYNLRKVKYEKHKIEKKIFEEQQRRRDKMRKYVQAIKARHFPVDADMLVTNFFKTVRKDPQSAQKLLESNPATFAPIQVDKIPPRFFGLIKPKPEDGKKVNRKLGRFLKNLKA